MVDLYGYQRPRRLPVFFMLDTSSEMIGTLEVTMQDGLLIVKRELVQYDFASTGIYLGGVTFNDYVTPQYLAPLDLFTPLRCQAHGSCHLRLALVSLTEALMFDLIEARADYPGDYRPLVFLVLGSCPADDWEEALPGLTALTGNRRPFIISLVTRPELVNVPEALSNHVLLLQSVEGMYLTHFFFWAARVIAKVYEDYTRGADSVDLPALPYGLAELR